MAARAGLTLLGGYRPLELNPPPPAPPEEHFAQLLAGSLVLLAGLAFYARSGLLREELHELSPRSDEPKLQRDLKRANVVVIGLALLGIVAAVVGFAWR